MANAGATELNSLRTTASAQSSYLVMMMKLWERREIIKWDTHHHRSFYYKPSVSVIGCPLIVDLQPIMQS